MTPWQEEIVVALANHLRVLSVEQIRKTWWREQRTGKQRAKESLRKLQRSGLVRMRNVFSRPIAALDSPILEWRCGMSDPDFDATANFLRRRARTEASVIQVVTAEPKARRLFGVGDQRSLKLTQVTHDLHVSEVFLRYFETGLPVYREWLGEDCLPKPWPVRERPDALVQDANGNILRAVEYGGEYTACRLSKLHRGFSKLSLPYEIW